MGSGIAARCLVNAAGVYHSFQPRPSENRILRFSSPLMYLLRDREFVSPTLEGKLDTRARAVYDLAAGRVLASVDLPSSREKVFPALTGPEVKTWWTNPGVFDTREWSADVRVGGSWRGSGVARDGPWLLEGQFREVDAYTKLVFTWRSVGGVDQDSVVTYLLEPVAGGTRLVLRHEGFVGAPIACVRSSAGWEACFEALGKLLSRG